MKAIYLILATMVLYSCKKENIAPKETIIQNIDVCICQYSNDSIVLGEPLKNVHTDTLDYYFDPNLNDNQKYMLCFEEFKHNLNILKLEATTIQREYNL